MAILPSQKNPLALLRQFRANLENRTGITNFDRDSKVRSIVDTLVDELLSDREELLQVFYAQQIGNAIGQNLIMKGESLGVPKRLARFADVVAEERNLAYYVSSGTFGDINGAADITITAGTTVFSDANQNELNATIQYTVTTTTVLPAAGVVGYVPARATVIGRGMNIGASVLRNHNFINYVDAAAGGLKVINFFPVLNGRDDETDSAYKFRISQNYNRLQTNNNARMLLTGLEIPGVRDVRTVPGYHGIGTAGVMVLGSENQINARMVNGVQEELQRYQTPGNILTAIAPTQVSIDLEIEATLSTQLNSAQQSELKNRINRSILQYFRGLGLGSTIDLAAMARRIHNDSTAIQSMSDPNQEGFFKRVYVRKGLPGTAADERERLITNFYSLASDEFAVIGTLDVSFATVGS